MKYKYILQEMKEMGGPNVVAFLKDAEHIRRMSKKERDFCLQNRCKPGALKRLIEEFIPYAIYVSYFNAPKLKTLSVLDLINEGILGAYAAFDKNRRGEVLTKRKVNCAIKSNIRCAVQRDYSHAFADIAIEEVEIDNLKLFI